MGNEANSLDGLVVIGMDPPSVRNCGWAVVGVVNNQPVILLKTTQQLKAEEKDPAKLREVYDKLKELIDQYHPTAVCMERSMGAGLNFVRANLSESTGVAKLCAYDNGISVSEISPGHLKKVLTGYGRAKKKDIKTNIVAVFNLTKSDTEHECDAAGCALVHLIDQGLPYTIKVPFVTPPKR